MKPQRLRSPKTGRPRHSTQAKKASGSYDATRDKHRQSGALVSTTTNRYSYPMNWTPTQRRLAQQIHLFLEENKQNDPIYFGRIKEYIGLSHESLRLRNIVTILNKKIEQLVTDTQLFTDKKKSKQIEALAGILSKMILAQKTHSLLMQQIEGVFGLTPQDRARLGNSIHIQTPEELSFEQLGSYSFGESMNSTAK